MNSPSYGRIVYYKDEVCAFHHFEEKGGHHYAIIEDNDGKVWQVASADIQFQTRLTKDGEKYA